MSQVFQNKVDDGARVYLTNLSTLRKEGADTDASTAAELAYRDAQIEVLSDALKDIVLWNQIDYKGAVDVGSNGVRDHYRVLAHRALVAAGVSV